MRRLRSIQAFLACGLVAAGCGNQAASSPATTKVDAATAACTKRIDASALSPALKDDLKKSCKQGASGDGMASPVQKTRRDVCRKIVLQRTPPGPARERGLAACALNTRNP